MPSLNLQRKHQVLPGISAVLCCHNSAEVITPTIAALSEQRIPRDLPYEVILVDNNCSDETVSLAQAGWNHPSGVLRVVFEEKRGLAFARMKGIEACQYHIIQFVDDDNVLDPDWMGKVYALFATDPKIGMIGGVNYPLIRGEPPAWFHEYQHVYACGPRADHSGFIESNLFGAGVAYRFSALLSVFPSDLPLFLVGRTGSMLLRGEDSEMAIRALLSGWRFYYDNTLSLKHKILDKRLTWHYICEARRGGGKANVVLKIYRNILEGKPPLTFFQCIRFVLHQLLRLFLSHPEFFLRTKLDGSLPSFKFHLLVGMVEGLFHFRNSYSKMRQRIIENYGSSSVSSDESGPTAFSEKIGHFSSKNIISRFRESHLPQDPIFIVGYPRSGTTLLQALLCTQEGVYSLPETHFFSYVFRSFKFDKHHRVNPKCLNDVLDRIEEMMRLNFSREAREEIQVIGNTSGLYPKDFFELIVSHHIEPQLTSLPQQPFRWMEKTPNHVYCLGRILSFYPRVQFVNIVRNPLFAIISRKQNFPNSRRIATRQLANQWAKGIESAERFAARHPERIAFIRYEELVADPYREIKRLCVFLRLTFEPSRLERYTDFTSRLILQHETWKTDVRYKKIASTNSFFRRQMHLMDVLKIQSVLGQEMKRYHYPLSHRLLQKAFEFRPKSIDDHKGSTHPFAGQRHRE